MSDESALLTAIIAHPDEDTPRLAFADWLDENGDPDRAAFIRVQCRLAEMPPDDPDWYELLEQESDLGSRLHDRITTLRPAVSERFYFGTYYPQADREPQFHRGFPFFVDYHGQQWTDAETARVADSLAKLVATTTIRGLSTSGIPAARLTDLIETPAFAALRALSLRFSGDSAWDDDFEARAFQRLSETPVGEHLHSLWLHHILSAKGLRTLATAKSFKSLRRLCLVYLRDHAANWGEVARAEWFQGVTHLQLAVLDPEVASAMSKGLGGVPSLHTLDLRTMDSEAVSNLTAGRFSRLVRFEASGCKLNNRVFQTLLQGEWFDQLQILSVSHNDLSDRAISNLAAHPVAPNLRVLRLGNNKIGRAGLMALAQPGRFSALRTLSLSISRGAKSQFSEADFASFLHSLCIPRLRRLELGGLPLGDAGAKAIAANPAFGGLRELWLGEGVTEIGMNALKTARHLQQTQIV